MGERSEHGIEPFKVVYGAAAFARHRARAGSASHGERPSPACRHAAGTGGRWRPSRPARRVRGAPPQRRRR
ncbi:MAG: hypothetical protein FJX59_01900 [Alphaproteobacteria bacterium]|nr:hypothetical protein [Alphaproteobacteria bacterium]